jgi:hypothetical protein
MAAGKAIADNCRAAGEESETMEAAGGRPGGTRSRI